MKEIKAIIQPFMAEKVISALATIEGLPGITVSEVKGFGRTRGRTEINSDEPIRYLKKTKLEVVVPDALAPVVVETIRKQAHTGNLGDGKIFVLPVEDAIRIRTGTHEDGEGIDERPGT